MRKKKNRGMLFRTFPRCSARSPLSGVSHGVARSYQLGVSTLLARSMVLGVSRTMARSSILGVSCSWLALLCWVSPRRWLFASNKSIVTCRQVSCQAKPPAFTRVSAVSLYDSGTINTSEVVEFSEFVQRFREPPSALRVRANSCTAQGTFFSSLSSRSPSSQRPSSGAVGCRPLGHLELPAEAGGVGPSVSARRSWQLMYLLSVLVPSRCAASARRRHEEWTEPIISKRPMRTRTRRTSCLCTLAANTAQSMWLCAWSSSHCAERNPRVPRGGPNTPGRRKILSSPSRDLEISLIS